MSKTTDLVAATVEKTIVAMGFDLVDVELVKEGQSRILFVYIQKENGITVEDCEKVSIAIDPLIEALDPVEDAYFLSVSSPGLDRPLKSPQDYLRALGTEVEVNLYRQIDGKKHHIGILKEYQETDGSIVLDTTDGSIHIEKNAISRIRPWITF